MLCIDHIAYFHDGSAPVVFCGDTLFARDESTVPSTLSLELATNPFLRCHQPAMHQALKSQGKSQGETAEQVFATVRGWKDNF